MESFPRPSAQTSSKDCAHCGAANAQRECVARCGTAYCDESCADTHWIEAQHYEFCGRAAGHGRGNLKKGALTRTAKAHHMSNPKFERWAEAQDKAHTGKVSAKTMKRVHLAETFSHMNHGGKK